MGDTSAPENSALQFLIASGDTPITDYFKFKKSGLPILSRFRGLSSESNLTSNDLHDASECMNVGISRTCSATGTPAGDVLLRKKVSTYELHHALNLSKNRVFITCPTRPFVYKSRI